MSSVDERIVRMEFDNTNFESGATKAIDILDKLGKALKFDDAAKGLDGVKQSLSGFSMDSVSESVEECSNRFGAFEAFVTGIFFNLGNRVANFGMDMAKNLTVKPLMDGFSEYELQMKSVQTILSNAGDKLKEAGYTTQEEQIAVINDRLDELNTYADKTIYNFSEMTRNIGTFTAAGVDLDTAVTSIQGIANLAAASGSSSQQASTAMYQLSQAIAAGSVKLQDWNSVVNAGMGGELFQNALKRTARAHGVAVDQMIEDNGSFRESLQEGWISADILTETLQQLTMTTEGLTEAEIESMKAGLESQGYTREEAEAILELANNAQEAATKVRTWSQLWETVGEALGSGWATTWRTIVGDFLEATDLFTHLSEGITGIIGRSADARNAVLADWAAAGGRNALVDGIKYAFDAVVSVVETIGNAFSDVFGISAEQLYNISVAFAEFAEKLVPSEEAVQFLYDLFYNVFTIVHSVLGVFGNFIRIVAHIAGVVWKLVSPFVKLALIIGGKIVQGFAILSSFILKVTDYLEAFVDFITSNFGGAIDLVYTGISKIWDAFGGLIGILKNIGKIAAGSIGSLVGAFVELIRTSGPVQKLSNVFTGLKDSVLGKLSGAFNKLTKSVTGSKKAHKSYAKYADLTPFQKLEVAVESAHSNFTKFIDGFNQAKDKVQYLKDIFGPLAYEIKSRFKSILNDTKLLDIFGPLIDNAKSQIGKIKPIFGNLKTYFSELAGSGKSLPQILATVFSDVYNKVAYWVTHIPETISKAKEAAKTAFDQFLTSTEGFRTKFVETLRDMLQKVPSPEEVAQAIGTFVSGIKQTISDKLGEVTGGKGFDFSAIISGITGAFGKLGDYISKIKIALPDNLFSGIFSSIITGLKEKFSEFINGINLDGMKEPIDKLVGQIGKILGKRAGVIVFGTVINFVNSLSKLNRGIGGFGKKFEKFGENIGEGLSKFGEGFTKYKKQTKAQAFMRIATGLLILAAALWVLSKVPSGRLTEVATVLGVLGLAIGAFMLVAAGLSKLGDLDMEGVGKGIAGFCIGILALAAAAWIISKLDPDQTWDIIGKLIAMIVVVGSMVALIAAAGGKLKGVAPTFIAFGIAMLLLTAAIKILGNMDPNVLHQGGNAVGLIAGVMTAAISIMELANMHKGSIFGAAPTLIALALAITLMIIPIKILGNEDPGVLKQGGNAVGQIAGFLAGAVAVIGFLGKHAASILAAVPAMLALTLCVGLMIIPIKILGNFGDEELKQGGIATGIIAGVLGAIIALIGFVGVNAAGILAGSVALVAMAVAVGLISIVVAGLTYLAGLNLDALGVAVASVMGIIVLLTIGLAAIGGVGTSAGIGMLAIAGGITAIGLSLMVLAQGISMLQNNVNWASISEGISNIFGAITTAASDFAGTIGNFIGQGFESIHTTVGGWISPITSKVGEMASSAIDAVKNFPSNMKEKATTAMSNFINSITSKQGAAKTASSNLKTNGIVNVFKDLSSVMKTKGSEGGDGLIAGLTSKNGGVLKAASGLIGAAKSGLSSLYDSFRNVGVNGALGLIDGIGSKIRDAANKAAQLASASVGAAKRELQEKSPSKVFHEIGAYAGEGFIIGVSDYFGKALSTGKELAQSAIDAISDTITTMSIGIEDLLDTDYNPVITPVINPAEFNSGLNGISSLLDSRFSGLSIGNLNYTGELSAKISDYNDLNKQAIEALANNVIDYDQLGTSVANALIRSGVHVEMDGGQMVGYLAGEIRDVRRMYTR